MVYKFDLMQERERLLQKLRAAKMYAKHGTKKKTEFDLLNYLNSRNFAPDSQN